MTNKGYIIVDPSELESKRHKTDGVMRSLCTECSEGHSYDETVRINMTTGFGHCYRCGAKYVLRSAYNEYTSRKALYYQHKNINYKKPDKAKVSNDEFPQDLQDYFASRCISMSTVKAAGIKWCTRGSDHVMAFVYYEAGRWSTYSIAGCRSGSSLRRSASISPGILMPVLARRRYISLKVR